MRNVLALAASMLLAGCVTTPAMTYQPSIDNTQLLMRDGRGKLAVDAFTASPTVDNTRLGVRLSHLTGGGSDGTFSGYLHDALQAELGTAGRLDPASPLRLSGTLTGNVLDGDGAKTGFAKVGAHFVLKRGAQTLYERDLSATHQWESSFIGAIAIPAAMQNYTTAVQKLLATLFGDPEFVAASNAPAPP